MALVTFIFPRLMKFIYFLSLTSLLPGWNISIEGIAKQDSLPQALRFIPPSLLRCSMSLGRRDVDVHLWLSAGLHSSHDLVPEASPMALNPYSNRTFSFHDPLLRTARVAYSHKHKCLEGSSRHIISYPIAAASLLRYLLRHWFLS